MEKCWSNFLSISSEMFHTIGNLSLHFWIFVECNSNIFYSVLAFIRRTLTIEHFMVPNWSTFRATSKIKKTNFKPFFSGRFFLFSPICWKRKRQRIECPKANSLNLFQTKYAICKQLFILLPQTFIQAQRVSTWNVPSFKRINTLQLDLLRAESVPWLFIFSS